MMLNDDDATLAVVTEMDQAQTYMYRLAQQHMTWPVRSDETAQAAHGL